MEKIKVLLTKEETNKLITNGLDNEMMAYNEEKIIKVNQYKNIDIFENEWNKEKTTKKIFVFINKDKYFIGPFSEIYLYEDIILCKQDNNYFVIDVEDGNIFEINNVVEKLIKGTTYELISSNDSVLFHWSFPNEWANKIDKEQFNKFIERMRY
jgi:hypothetical protein